MRTTRKSVNNMNGGYILGQILGSALIVLLYVAAWESAKKRKIGLTITSFLTLFLTPFIACIVTWFTKKIDRTTKDVPSYEQRLPYEFLTGILVAAILFMIFGVLYGLLGIIMIANNGRLTGILICICSITWGIKLLIERKKLVQVGKNQCEKDVYASPNKKETAQQHASSMNMEFESKRQYKVVDNNTMAPVFSARKLILHQKEGNTYELTIISLEDNQPVVNSLTMREKVYSDVDECHALESLDGEYVLNVFYKNHLVEKCVVSRKSKNVFIHYCKE